MTAHRVITSSNDATVAELRAVALPALNGLPNNSVARLTERPLLGTLLASARPLVPYILGIAMLGTGLYVGSGCPPPDASDRGGDTR
ncbi:MAG: hypothetical protein H7Z42_06200 [Roseiflexaceae bacterium]|nr:hypothetical protein [Roseiflexaceae bacterium]